ncbi:MAG TPA: BTAD domain-containing putative transcriptional regulator [Gemmatimonadaceae bacterium]
MFSLRLFGGATLASPEGVLTGRVAQRHRLALLALLAGAGPCGISRDKLLACLTPELPDERARHLLSNSLYLLRHTLGVDAVIGACDMLRLDSGMISVDVVSFTAALARGDRETAVGLYAGPFLDGFFLRGSPEFEQWAMEARERFSGACLAALEALAHAAEVAGDLRARSMWWGRCAAHDPLSSRLALRYMESLAVEGDPEAAVRHAGMHTMLVHQRLGMEPHPSVAAFADRLRMH